MQKGSVSDYVLSDSLVNYSTTDRDLFLIAMFLLIINGGMIWIYKHKVIVNRKSEIQMEVNAAVAQYFALRGDEPVV